MGRKADNLFGAYNVNQVEYRSNGFLDAFNTVKAGGESALMNQLVAGDTRRATGESGSAMVRRLFPTQLSLNSVAEVAASLGSRVQSNRTLPEIAGLGSFFLFPYPQFLTGVFVIDSEDYSRYHALEIKLDRRFSNGYSYLVGYTLSRSRDTRSFDPAFTVAATGSGQSASSTPFNVFDRDLNYALSDFDRTHVFQAQGVFELPFGQEKRFGGNVNRLTDVFIGGWTLSGQLVAQSGRPMTVYRRQQHVLERRADTGQLQRVFAQHRQRSRGRRPDLVLHARRTGEVQRTGRRGIQQCRPQLLPRPRRMDREHVARQAHANLRQPDPRDSASMRPTCSITRRLDSRRW